MNKHLPEWLGFGLGVTLGVVLAFVFYVGLQPRITKAIADKQAIEQRNKARLALTDSLQQAKQLPAKKTSQPAAISPLLTAAPPKNATLTLHHSPLKSYPSATHKPTQLTPTISPNSGLSRQAWRTLLLTTVSATLAAGAGAWWQMRERPKPDVVKSKVLEALLALKTHQQMQQRLGLTPRQIKRFNSKARVQHSQLQALAQPAKQASAPRPWWAAFSFLGAVFPSLRLPNQSSEFPLTPEFPFLVARQIQAFQLLLLLEENRQQPDSLLNASRPEFIWRIQKAYLGHSDLAKARQEASENKTINKHQESAEAYAQLDRHVAPRLLEQFYEMNVGLLA